jgi:hypothetical protein
MELVQSWGWVSLTLPSPFFFFSSSLVFFLLVFVRFSLFEQKAGRGRGAKEHVFIRLETKEDECEF